MANFNINTAGFVIVGMFILTWLTALLVWRYGQIEKKWSATLKPATAGGMAPGVGAADRGEPKETAG
jgi:hypothetical protein